jgi:hypothetical protein
MRAFHVTVRTPSGASSHFAIGRTASTVHDFTAASQSDDEAFGITVVEL